MPLYRGYKVGITFFALAAAIPTIVNWYSVGVKWTMYCGMRAIALGLIVSATMLKAAGGGVTFAAGKSQAKYVRN